MEFLILCGLLVAAVLRPVCALEFAPFGTTVGDTLLPRNDDDSSTEIFLPAGFVFFDVVYKSLYVSQLALCDYSCIQTETMTDVYWYKVIEEQKQFIVTIYQPQKAYFIAMQLFFELSISQHTCYHYCVHIYLPTFLMEIHIKYPVNKLRHSYMIEV